MNLIELWRNIHAEARGLKRYDDGERLLALAKDFVRDAFKTYHHVLLKVQITERFVRKYGDHDTTNFLSWSLQASPQMFLNLPPHGETWLKEFILIRIHYDRFCKDAVSSEILKSQVLLFISELERRRKRICDLQNIGIDPEHAGIKACVSAAFNWICTHEYFCERFWQSPFQDGFGNFWYYENCRLHKASGPAVVLADGQVQYWLADVQYDNEFAWRCVAETLEQPPACTDILKVGGNRDERFSMALESFKLHKRTAYSQAHYKELAKRFFARKGRRA